MLEHLLELRTIKYVFVHKVDRLARNRADDITITLAIRQSGASLVSASENIDETPSGKLLHGIMATIAEFYSSNLATEAIKGARQKVKVGGTPYKPPIGYLTARERVQGREIRTVIVDPERAPQIRWAFTAYASGEYTLRDLTEALEARGLRYQESKKLVARPMAMNAVNWMLNNRYYLGIVTYEGVAYPGRHEPLVDEATFEAVQAIMAARKVSGEKPKKRPHYLKGRLFCGRCGGRMGIGYSRSYNGTIYPYFYCIGRQKKRASCPQTFVPLHAVEAAAVAYWKKWVRLDDAQVAEIWRVVLDWMLERQASSGKHVAAQRLRIERLEREQQKLTQAYLADALPVDALKVEQDRVHRELASARGLIEKYQADYQSIEAALDHALLMCKIGAVAYEHAEPEVRRQLVQAAFDKLWIIGDEIAGCDLKPGYVTLLDSELAATLARQAEEDTPGGDTVPVEQPSEGQTYYRHTGSTSEPLSGSVLSKTTFLEEDWWLPVERPRGRLPWEETNSGPDERVRSSNVANVVDILRAYSKRGDLLDDLTQLDHRLQRALRDKEPGQRRSVSSTGRVDRKIKLEDRLTEEQAEALVSSFVAGTTKRQLAERYGISPKSVQRLLRRHGVWCETGRRPKVG